MKTPITYYGGKQNLSDLIISMMPKHRIYCEPFFGGGAVFFEKPKAGVEVINDTNEMLINFYSVCRKKFKDLQEMVRDTLHSEAMFNKARDIYRSRLQANDIEKAWALWVMANECHAMQVAYMVDGSFATVRPEHISERFSKINVRILTGSYTNAYLRYRFPAETH